ncbi:hypothetical protein Ac42p036 [Acinetobacter phage Ac42]|uniref:hypothetical protein n=1 Tax=Acinetobacter phage Ac42 TaxID=762660 RepID=UPI0001EBCC86|nr:hypothetical protein Ac42p036 [Acinetobacter phage Ac42]ADI96274.1 hypothetical protein Ac42p036 [Acinetobacter phage Ac42]
MSYDQIMTGMFVFNILFFLLLAVLGSVAAERSSKPDTWHDRFLFARTALDCNFYCNCMCIKS